MATRNVKWGLLAFLSALLVVLLILLVTGIVEAGPLALVGAAIAVAAVAALIAWLIRFVTRQVTAASVARDFGPDAQVEFLSLVGALPSVWLLAVNDESLVVAPRRGFGKLGSHTPVGRDRIREARTRRVPIGPLGIEHPGFEVRFDDGTTLTAAVAKPPAYLRYSADRAARIVARLTDGHEGR